MENHRPEPAIPFRIRIGVTGHRTLLQEQTLLQLVREIITKRYLEAFDSEARHVINAHHVAFTVVSPLAEGADRLVARAVLEFPDSMLIAVIPSDLDEYTGRFTSPESRDDFALLLQRAHHCIRLETEVTCLMNDYNQGETGRGGFQEIGEYVIEHCDILIALWDGKPARGKGGTADITSMAIKKGMPVFIIHTDEHHQVALINGGTFPLSSLDRIS
jgi:hypothetical protein